MKLFGNTLVKNSQELEGNPTVRSTLKLCSFDILMLA